jgi:hypothetical protein
MHDGRGILLDFDMSPSLINLADRYNDRMKYVPGRAKEQLGLSAVLIRPDGFIAWACEGELNLDSVQRAVTRWFGGPLTVR